MRGCSSKGTLGCYFIKLIRTSNFQFIINKTKEEDLKLNCLKSILKVTRLSQYQHHQKQFGN